MTDIVGKLWGFCHTLRHDGIDYGNYIEQLTYPLFLKMAGEKGVEIPKEEKAQGQTFKIRFSGLPAETFHVFKKKVSGKEGHFPNFI